MSRNGHEDTMRERISTSRLSMWLFTRTNRWTLAAGLSLMVFAALVVSSSVAPVPMRVVIETADATWWVFSSMVTAIITTVALVVSLNQLVLSQELGELGEQRERMAAARTFRSELEPLIDRAVAPPDPASFLGAILDAIQSQSTALGECLEMGAIDEPVDRGFTPEGEPLERGEWDEAPAHEEIDAFATEVAENARSVGDALESAQFGTFDVVFATLDFEYSWWIYETRRLLAVHEATLDERTVDVLEDLLDVLVRFGPAREHVKTLYFQWELVNLSRSMLLASIPALLVALWMLLSVDPTGLTGTTFGVDHLVWLVAGAVVITLSPFFILLSYVLRIATVAKRTLAVGPFVLRETRRSGEPASA